MPLILRGGVASDAADCGDILYRAFKAIADAHNFPPDFPSAQMATAVAASLLGHPRFHGVIAEADGRIVGSNFLDERNPISGVGPITVDPAVQNDGAGRALMDAVLRRSDERGFAGVRLVQAGYHNRSLALYLKLGFEAREQLACLQGPAVAISVPGCSVRAAAADDLPACERLCFRVHGHDRGGELADAISQRAARMPLRVWVGAMPSWSNLTCRMAGCPEATAASNAGAKSAVRSTVAPKPPNARA